MSVGVGINVGSSLNAGVSRVEGKCGWEAKRGGGRVILVGLGCE